ncbi:MAG: hypothetical protein JNK82_15970 [Myxococcaceae bacterium]|nr:hypothetical protein [Myxococcaceae bacterium]
MNPTPGWVASGAVCPEHPQSPSVGTCTRCGRFVCAGCRVVSDPVLCRACAPMAMDPLGIVSAHFSAGATLRNGWRMFITVLPVLLPIAAIFSVPAGLISAGVESLAVRDSMRATIDSQRVVNFYDALIGLIGDIGALALFVGVAEGKTFTLGQALKEGTSAWGAVFGARFRGGLITLLFTLLLIVPGIWKGVLLAFVVESAFRVRGQDALEYSTSLVTGRWWPVFGVLLLSALVAYVPAMVFGGVMGAVGELAHLPVVAIEILTDFGARLADMLLAAFSLATFYGLNRTDGRQLPPMTWA